MFKRNLIIALAAGLTLTSLAAGNGLNLNGLGTPAQAMGGAFIGVADDFSAVFWNPADRDIRDGFFSPGKDPFEC